MKEELKTYRLQNELWDQLFRTTAPQEAVAAVVDLARKHGIDYTNGVIYNTLRSLGYEVEVIESEIHATFKF